MALAKPDGGIRPIAVGECIRRLVGKCLCQRYEHEAKTYLRPWQIGVAAPLGAESGPQAVRQWCENNASDTDRVVFLADFEFDAPNRELMKTLEASLKDDKGAKRILPEVIVRLCAIHGVVLMRIGLEISAFLAAPRFQSFSEVSAVSDVLADSEVLEETCIPSLYSDPHPGLEQFMSYMSQHMKGAEGLEQGFVGFLG